MSNKGFTWFQFGNESLASLMQESQPARYLFREIEPRHSIIHHEILPMRRPLHLYIHRQTMREMEGRRSTQVQDLDWMGRLSQFVTALTPDGIRAVGELWKSILIGFSVPFLLVYVLFALTSNSPFDKALIFCWIVLRFLGDSKRSRRAGR